MGETTNLSLYPESDRNGENLHPPAAESAERLRAVLRRHEHLYYVLDAPEIDDAAYDALTPLRWPLPVGAAGEGGRMFAQGGFPTPDGRGRAIAVRAAPAAAGMLLNTGRVRDQWHTMTRTGRVPELARHTPEPLLAINPADAARLGVADGALVELSTGHGNIRLPFRSGPRARRPHNLR